MGADNKYTPHTHGGKVCNEVHWYKREPPEDPRMIRCGECGGTGEIVNDGPYSKCGDCDGTGCAIQHRDVMERAREVLKAIREAFDRGPHDGSGNEREREALAQALTETHNAALEEAAGIADKAARYWHEYAYRHTLPMARKRGDDLGELADEIRRAKSTEKV